jgi:uncharacterized protein
LSREALELRGGWALVTGASAGIGEALARVLAARGSHLVLSARRGERLEALAEELQQNHGVQAVAIAADLSLPGEGERLWREASEGREVRLLVNNAGFGAKGELHEVPSARQLEMVQVNCAALLELSHAALATMRDHPPAAILNVASIAAFQPVPTMATYGASKAFVLSLSEALAEENRHSGVRVVALCPGPVMTEFQEVAGTRVTPRTLGHRTAEEVAEAGVRAVEEGRRVVVPGLVNRLGTYLERLPARGLVLRGARVILSRFR